jgi:hypothetical protein
VGKVMNYLLISFHYLSATASANYFVVDILEWFALSICVIKEDFGSYIWSLCLVLVWIKFKNGNQTSYFCLYVVFTFDIYVEHLLWYSYCCNVNFYLILCFDPFDLSIFSWIKKTTNSTLYQFKSWATLKRNQKMS